MKLKYIICFLSLFVIMGAKPVTGLDERKYVLEDELLFSILMYDYYNSGVLSLLGEESAQPDRAGQIEAARQKDSGRVFEVEMQLSYIKGCMNMLRLKSEIIENFHKEGVSLMKGNYSFPAVIRIMKPYTEQVEETIRETKQIAIEEAVASYIFFNSKVDLDLFEKGLHLSTVNSSILIAISRFDNLKWKKIITDCIQEHYKDGASVVDDAISCAQPYVEALATEAVKISKDLKVLDMMIGATPLPDKSEMEKVVSEDGSSYMWREKK